MLEAREAGSRASRGHTGEARQPRIWPFPSITNFGVVSSRRPIGPRAWSFWVEMPISAPKPELLAVDEAGRGVDEHGGGVDLAGPAVGGGEVGGDDGLAVARAVAG